MEILRRLCFSLVSALVWQNTMHLHANFMALTGHFRGLSFHATGGNQQKHRLSFFRPLVELISCFLAVNKQACCNPLDKYRREYSNQLKAICKSVLEPAARDFLPCHLS